MGCYKDGTLVSGATRLAASCCKQGQTCESAWDNESDPEAESLWDGKNIVSGKESEVAKFSDKIIALRKVYGAVELWTVSSFGNGNTSQNSCYAFSIGPKNGGASGSSRGYYSFFALCE